MHDFETSEQTRPEFIGKVIPSYITGQSIVYFPSQYRKKRIYINIFYLLILILIILGIVTSIYIIRFTLQKKGINTINSQTIASIINAIQIQLVNKLYNNLAKYLTNKENYRTITEHEDSMVIKLFFFQFINSYASFFYIAFIAEIFHDCSNNSDNCMATLSLNLGIVFGLRLFINFITKVCIPYFHYWKDYKQDIRIDSLSVNLTRPEQEFLLRKVCLICHLFIIIIIKIITIVCLFVYLSVALYLLNYRLFFD